MSPVADRATSNSSMLLTQCKHVVLGLTDTVLRARFHAAGYGIVVTDMLFTS